MRMLIIRRNHVAVAAAPSPIADTSTSRGRCSMMPLPSSISHTAMSASGNADNCASTNDHTMSPGSWRYPSLHSRHIDLSAGGSGSGEGFIRLPFLVLRGVEALCLQVEHRPISAAAGDQLVMRAKLHDAAVLEHAGAVGVTHR